MEHQKKITGLISLASYLFSVIFIAIGFFVGLRGAKTMEIFDKFPGLITPVKYVVWIWIPIWLLLGVYALFQLFTQPKNAHQNFYSLRNFFIVGNILTVLWILSWHLNRTLWSFIFSLLLLAITSLQLKVSGHLAKIERNMTWMPAVFGMNLGLSVFLVAENLSALLKSMGLPTQSSQLFAVLFLALIALFGLFFIIGNREFFFGLVILWGLTGVLLKHIFVYKAAYKIVLTVNFLLIGLMLVSMINLIQGNRRKKKEKKRRRKRSVPSQEAEREKEQWMDRKEEPKISDTEDEKTVKESAVPEMQKPISSEDSDFNASSFKETELKSVQTETEEERIQTNEEKNSDVDTDSISM